MQNEVSSEDIHLFWDAETVVETKRLTDVNAGMNPCYYIQADDHVKCSTSVTSLITSTGQFEFNANFTPPNFISKHDMRNDKDKPPLLRLANRVLERVPETVEHYIREVYESKIDYQDPWYVSWETIDKRIRKLKPFEKVTPEKSESEFSPTKKIQSKDQLVEKTADVFAQYVRRVEDEFPKHNHVVLTGGKDSLLITLVEKQNPEQWHIFSSDPNYEIVEKFLKDNSIVHGDTFRDGNEKNESKENTWDKIIDSDLYSDPRHFRWLNHLADIRDQLHPCIFWTGMEGDTINAYHPDYHGRSNFFDLQFTRALSWQGNHLQVMKNYVDSPFISAYHGEEMWEEIYHHYDPSVMGKGDDIREDIGRKLHEGEVHWPTRNPGPVQYDYESDIPMYELYINHIVESLTR